MCVIVFISPVTPVYRVLYEKERTRVTQGGENVFRPVDKSMFASYRPSLKYLIIYIMHNNLKSDIGVHCISNLSEKAVCQLDVTSHYHFHKPSVFNRLLIAFDEHKLGW